jgi:NADPH:quinone reductase-like Zn-dependent oxidoreductase
MGVDTVLDYRQPLPIDQNDSFDVVFDCNGSIASRDADRLLKRGGALVDIAVTLRKVL